VADSIPLPALIQLAYQSADAAITMGLRRRGFDVTRAHSSVLANIDVETGTRLTVLADRASVTKQAIGQVVAELETRGFVKRTPDPQDGRAKLVRLTAGGRNLIAAAYEVIGQIEAAVLNQVGSEGVEATRTTLAALVSAAEKAASER
jgi:DNA-binding MarR family transcriptional regulator